MAALEAYLDGLALRLASSGFAVWPGVPLNPFVLDILAARRRLELSKFGEMARVIAVAHPEHVSPYAVTSYSAWVTKYALGGGFESLPRGLGGSVLCVPAVLADRFDEPVKEWISQYQAPKHWAAFEFPALVSLFDGRVYCCTTAPFWGGAYYGGFRRFVEEVLHP